MNTDDNMARVNFMNACKNISMDENDDPINILKQKRAMQGEYGVEIDQDDETALVL